MDTARCWVDLQTTANCPHLLIKHTGTLRGSQIIPHFKTMRTASSTTRARG